MTSATEIQNQWNDLFEPTLESLNWQGCKQHLKAVMSLDEDTTDMEGFRDVMAHLGFKTILHKINSRKINERLLPAVLVNKKGPELITNIDDAKLPNSKMTVLSFEHEGNSVKQGDNKEVKRILHKFDPLLHQVMLFSLFIGMLALSPIIFNRAVYDNIIGSGSTTGLGMMIAGVSMAIILEILLRKYRTSKLSYFGARIDHYISCVVFERLLFLSPAYTEKSAVSSQLARLKDFESIREFFTGSLAYVLFELPLVAVYIIVMAILAGWLVLVPIGLVIAYGLLILIMGSSIKRKSKYVANAISKRHEFLLEMVTHMPAIRLAGLEEAWKERYREISAKASLASFKTAFSSQILESISYVLMTIGSVATLVFGVVLVIEGNLTSGALIASMILIWRIVAPMQVVCSSATRFSQLFSSSKQVQRLLSVDLEHEPYSSPAPLNIKGDINFKRVTMRYTNDSEPALLGASFDIKKGQVLTIKGGNGSGKSSILKLIMGLYHPQGGSISIDGVDIRQMDPLALRQAISYVPQNANFFSGTIKDNLKFVLPTASEEEIMGALKKACALEEVNELINGLDTHIAGEKAEGVSFLLKHKINLARAYLRPSKILLFDEASHSLGTQNDKAFINMIESLRGQSTVILATHREDHMKLGDQMIVMDKGEIIKTGTPEKVLKAR